MTNDVIHPDDIHTIVDKREYLGSAPHGSCHVVGWTFSDAEAGKRTVNGFINQYELLDNLAAVIEEYYDDYMQDEADDPAICIDDRQHRLAIEIRDTLAERRKQSDAAKAAIG